MRKTLLLSLTLFISFSAARAQNPAATDCYTVKYLDFFGLGRFEILKWPDEQIAALQGVNFSQLTADSVIRTNYIIPQIAAQLKKFYPSCNDEIDAEYFNKIASLYCSIRGIDVARLQEMPVGNQIDFIRNDFYKQAESPQYLPFMSFSLGQGPFYGTDSRGVGDLELIKMKDADFGRIAISKLGAQRVITGYDKTGRVLWQKTLTGAGGRFLSEVHFSELPVQKTSLSTVVKMFAEGEPLTICLDDEGRFLYYFHAGS